MPTIREGLNATGMSLPIFCGGNSRVGINIAGSFVGTLKFYASVDGLNFNLVSAQPFASGTAVSSVTTTGNWWLDCSNYLAVMVTFTSRTSGTALVTISAAQDASYQDAFLTAAVRQVSQSHAAGAANTITQALQANRAWRVTKVVVGWSAAPSAAVLLTITDGTGGTVIWETYIPVGATGLIGTYDVPLPPGGLVGTVGNALLVSAADPGGSVVSKLNCMFQAA